MDAIQIKPSTVSCPAHGEHLRENWPSGFAAFSITIVQGVLETPNTNGLFRELGVEGQTQPKLDTRKLNEITERKPFCYFAGRELIQKALLEMGTLKIGFCENCGRSNIGGPYTVNIMGRDSRYEHFCVTCALDAGENLHRAHPNGGVWRD